MQLLLNELVLSSDQEPNIEGEFYSQPNDQQRSFKRQLLASAAKNKLLDPAMKVSLDKPQLILHRIFQST